LFVQDDGENADDAVEASSAGSKVVISKLADATTRACGLFVERVRECKARTRPDIIKHLVQMFDLRFLQELIPLTTGNLQLTTVPTPYTAALQTENSQVPPLVHFHPSSF
jgi:hypothetical protein